MPQQQLQPYGRTLLPLALLGSTYMALRSVRRGKLTPGAAVLGWATGVYLVGAGLRGLLLFVFYLLGSRATSWRAREKAELAEGPRTALQVFCVSGLAVFYTCLGQLQHPTTTATVYYENRQSYTSCAYSRAILAQYASSLADTLASELSVVSAQNDPWLITNPWRRVPRGCNGGVTWVGFGWSLVGGAVMGCMAVLLDRLETVVVIGWAAADPQVEQPVLALIVYSTLMGLLGSLIDSIIGATLQATYWDPDTKKIVSGPASQGVQRLVGWDCFSNEMVNLVSTAITTVLGGWVFGPLML